MPPKRIVIVHPIVEPLIPAFIRSRHHDVQICSAALESRDFATIQDVGHRLKGSGGSYGFDALTCLGEKLEDAAKSRNAKAASRYITKIDHYFETIDIQIGKPYPSR